MFDSSDTIVAISSAAGLAARAIVRLSGPAALSLACQVFHPSGASLLDSPGFRRREGVIDLGSRDISLPARAYVFRAPRSYTRQDLVEFHIPGSPIAASALTAALIELGARAAGAGEFTARAFFSGRIDLSQAEAVADVIDAADEAQLRSAVWALGGQVRRLCSQAAAKLTDALATVEASIDLEEEGIVLESPAALAGRLKAQAGHLRQIAQQAGDMPDRASCPHVTIVGRPNVGKSSLLNALSGTDRAIVSALAGTTRDVLSAPLHLQGGSVTLQDAAGFGQVTDSIARAADRAARAAIAASDAIIFLCDISADSFGPDASLLAEVRTHNGRCPLIAAANKCDLLDAEALRQRVAQLAALPGNGDAVLAVSAASGQGLAELKAALAERLRLSAERSGSALGLPQRQKRCLREAAAVVDAAADSLAAVASLAQRAELVAIDLRSALAQLGLISGQVVTEDVLGRIFERFCVGK
ncbi:MAG: GTPase [Phycisphaerae bacterium]|jgi:tRNA modification GTPase